MSVAAAEFATTLPTRPAGEPRPGGARRISSVSPKDRLNLAAALGSSVALSLLLFGTVAPLSGAIGYVGVNYLLFVAIYATLVALVERGPAVLDRVVTVLLVSAAGVTFAGLVFVIGFTLLRGQSAMFHANFFTHDMAKAGPLDPVTVGGIVHALVGTVWMTGLALLATVPLGVAAAVYLNEVGGRVAGLVRTIVDAMTALPSIVAGLFVYATWILTFHYEKSGLAASMAVSVVMLPIIIRSADVVLRLVPQNLREASAALGAPQWRTALHVVLPTARSGLVTSIILGTARGIGETAPVLLTAGFTAVMNTNPIHGPMVSLPLAAFEFIKSPQPAMVARGFATAAFLMIVVLVLFGLARAVGGRGPGHLSRRQQRSIARASASDLRRMSARRPITPVEAL